MRLTDIVIKSLPPPNSGQRTYTDDTLPGFGVRVSQGGAKTFVVVAGASRERATIGRYPVISLAEARAEAKRLLAERTLGKRKAPKTLFRDALQLFVETHCAQKNRPRTAKDTERLLRRHFEPSLGRKSLEDVTTHHISAITDRLLKAGLPGAANHAYTAVKTLLRWCVRRRYIPHSPIDGLELPTKAVPRERVLSDGELAVLLAKASSMGQFGVLVELLILTGQRRSEIAALHNDMIDSENQTITLPKWLCKNNREHVFPYGDRVAAILETLPQQGLLLPARGSDTPISGFSTGMLTLRKECGFAHWTLHDLRRSFSTGLARLGVAPHTIEAVLNHVSGGTLTPLARVYNRHSYLPEARQAVALWEKHIASLPTT